MAPTGTAKCFTQLVRGAPRGRFDGIKRTYSPAQVESLRGTLVEEHTLATVTANKLWHTINDASQPHVAALGCVTGNQAVQCVRAGLQAIYLSGWQVAADGNVAQDTYPDQSLYPSNSGPMLAKRINNALLRADQIDKTDPKVVKTKVDWIKPIVADAEAGFGGALHCFEITKAYINAGAGGVHLEDQLGAEKKCGHMGGKVLIPTSQAIRHLNAARLAADVMGVPTVLIARTDAESARLLTSDVDERDTAYIDYAAGRTPEGFHQLAAGLGIEHSIARGIAQAPYADMMWMETSTPDLMVARQFAEAVRAVGLFWVHPGKLLAYNCSPSFNWGQHMTEIQMADFQRELNAMGYRFQFVTLAGFHANNFGMYDLARRYKDDGMKAYNELQQKEFVSATEHEYTAVRHQREAGAGYFDAVASVLSGGNQATTAALAGSTEEHQFYAKPKSDGTPHHARAMSTSAATAGTPDGLKFTKSMEQFGASSVLTPDAIAFLHKLHVKFNSRRLALLDARQERKRNFVMPDFDSATEEIRNSDWKVSPAPKDMQDRRVEITGPPDAKMVINALNSGARVFMADFEDSNAPTWSNQVQGQTFLKQALREKLTFEQPNTGKMYKLRDDGKVAILNVRPRGWHLPEKHVLDERDQPMSGSLFDAGLYLWHNAKYLMGTSNVSNTRGPYLYLPKLEHWKEAELWNDVFNFTEQELRLPIGSIKCTVLIEHINAAFQMHEILHALKKHIVGLNCGRWDYIFSYIKVFQHSKDHILPDRFSIGMTNPFMSAYSQLTIKTCHARGAHAMGGMAAQIPIKNDAAANDRAMQLVREDKLREVDNGHDGTWVAHPGLVQPAIDIFDSAMPAPNQIHTKPRHDVTVGQAELLELPQGSNTMASLRHNINVNLGYMTAWLGGTGCVPLHNLMEDAATAEISRAQLWQWRKNGCLLSDGSKIDMNLIEKVTEEESNNWLSQMSDEKSQAHLRKAVELLQDFVGADELDDFLTLAAYDEIVKAGH